MCLTFKNMVNVCLTNILGVLVSDMGEKVVKKVEKENRAKVVRENYKNYKEVIKISYKS